MGKARSKSAAVGAKSMMDLARLPAKTSIVLQPREEAGQVNFDP